MTRINTTLLKKHKSSFDNVRSTFKSSSYSTFSSSYINSCSDSTVIRMKSKLKSLYDAIDKGYNNINGWWSSYNNDVDSLERALSSDGTSNNISKSSIRNYVNSNLPELEGYKQPFSDTFNLNFDNTSSIQNMNNVLDTINLSFTSNSDNNFYVDNSTKSWWQDKAASFKDKALNFFSNVGAKVSDCYESVTETITNAKDDFVDWVKEDALPYINKCYSNYQEANNMVNSANNLTSATSALATISLGEGFLKFGEKILDFATIAGAAMNTEVTRNIDNATFVHSALTTGEAKYGTATEDMWKSTQSFVAKNYVNSWYDDFYEKNKIGQYIKENAMGFDTVRTVSSGLGELGGNIALSVLTLGGSGATSLATNMSNVMVTNAFSAGFGNGAENAWANGASLEEGLTTATVNGSWEAFQWWVGTKIGGWNPFKGGNTSSKLMNILLRVGADAIDGGVEGFAQPAISTIYQDGYYDADGNYIEFTDKDNWWKRYTELFDDTGGWMNVGLQTAIGAGGSLIGEIGEFNKILKDQKTTIDLPETINVKPVDVIVDKQPKLTLDDLKYKKQGVVPSIISMFESSVNRYTYSDTNLFDGLNDNILGKGLYHFTDAADKILESGYIKASGESYIGPLGYLGPSYGNPKTFFFNGIPEVGAFATNLDSIPLKTTAVKVIPDVDVVDSPSLKVRNLDDGAITYDGRFDLSNGKTSKEYFCLVKENNELLYKPVSQEFFNNYENTNEGRILQQFLNDKRNIQSIKDDYLVGLSVRNVNAKVTSGSSIIAESGLLNLTQIAEESIDDVGVKFNKLPGKIIVETGMNATAKILNVGKLLKIVREPDEFAKFLDFDNNKDLFDGTKLQYALGIRQLLDAADKNKIDLGLTDIQLENLKNEIDIIELGSKFGKYHIDWVGEVDAEYFIRILRDPDKIKQFLSGDMTDFPGSRYDYKDAINRIVQYADEHNINLESYIRTVSIDELNILFDNNISNRDLIIKICSIEQIKELLKCKSLAQKTYFFNRLNPSQLKNIFEDMNIDEIIEIFNYTEDKHRCANWLEIMNLEQAKVIVSNLPEKEILDMANKNCSVNLWLSSTDEIRKTILYGDVVSSWQLSDLLESELISVESVLGSSKTGFNVTKINDIMRFYHNEKKLYNIISRIQDQDLMDAIFMVWDDKDGLLNKLLSYSLSTDGEFPEILCKYSYDNLKLYGFNSLQMKRTDGSSLVVARLKNQVINGQELYSFNINGQTVYADNDILKIIFESDSDNRKNIIEKFLSPDRIKKCFNENYGYIGGLEKQNGVITAFESVDSLKNIHKIMETKIEKQKQFVSYLDGIRDGNKKMEYGVNQSPTDSGFIGYAFNSFESIKTIAKKHNADLSLVQYAMFNLDNTGACSYADRCNTIFFHFKDDPELFKKSFGYDMYIEVNGKKQLNSKALLTDLFLFANSTENGGSIFYTDVSTGKLLTSIRNINMEKQIYVSRNDPVINAFFKKNNLNIKVETNIIKNYGDDFNLEYLVERVKNELANGNMLSISEYSVKGEPIKFKNLDGIMNASTKSWRTDDSHITTIVDVADKGFEIITWGHKYLIKFEDLTKDNFLISLRQFSQNTN